MTQFKKDSSIDIPWNSNDNAAFDEINEIVKQFNSYKEVDTQTIFVQIKNECVTQSTFIIVLIWYVM